LDLRLIDDLAIDEPDDTHVADLGNIDPPMGRHVAHSGRNWVRRRENTRNAIV
jgi:hypothetical protein